jgi:hypothetical protein
METETEMIDQRRAFRISALIGEAQARAASISSVQPAAGAILTETLADLEHELNALFEPPRGAGDGASTGANGPEQSGAPSPTGGYHD